MSKKHLQFYCSCELLESLIWTCCDRWVVNNFMFTNQTRNNYQDSELLQNLWSCKMFCGKSCAIRYLGFSSFELFFFSTKGQILVLKLANSCVKIPVRINSWVVWTRLSLTNCRWSITDNIFLFFLKRFLFLCTELRHGIRFEIDNYSIVQFHHSDVELPMLTFEYWIILLFICGWVVWSPVRGDICNVLWVFLRFTTTKGFGYLSEESFVSFFSKTF
jgi:hypothetical protein